MASWLLMADEQPAEWPGRCIALDGEVLRKEKGGRFMRGVPQPAHSERHNAYLDRRTKDIMVSTYLILRHSQTTIESAKQF